MVSRLELRISRDKIRHENIQNGNIYCDILISQEEDNDPEMQEYRKKMEEQKRLREKLLREKENRRKMAAMEKQNEDGKTDSNAAGT